MAKNFSSVPAYKVIRREKTQDVVGGGACMYDLRLGGGHAATRSCPHVFGDEGKGTCILRPVTLSAARCRLAVNGFSFAA